MIRDQRMRRDVASGGRTPRLSRDDLRERGHSGISTENDLGQTVDLCILTTTRTSSWLMQHDDVPVELPQGCRRALNWNRRGRRQARHAEPPPACHHGADERVGVFHYSHLFTWLAGAPRDSFVREFREPRNRSPVMVLADGSLVIGIAGVSSSEKAMSPDLVNEPPPRRHPAYARSGSGRG